MNHVLDIIATDHYTLTRAERAHADQCPLCGSELRMMERIERGIANLPPTPQTVPARLRSLVFQRIGEPMYRLWHILAAGFLVFVSPLFLRHFAQHGGMQLSGDMLTVVFAGYGILIVLLILPLSYRLFEMFNADVHDFEHRVDALLDHHPLRAIGAMGVAIRKRVGF